MAEMIKNTNMDDISSRVQSTVGQVKDKVSGMTGPVVDTFQENRQLLSYIGLGLVLVGAGFGIWSLWRNRSGISTSDNYEFSGQQDFRSASQY